MGGETVVKAFGVEDGDLVVLGAVVGEDFAAFLVEGEEGGGPGADVGGVEGLRGCGVVRGEGGGVPGWGVDYVFEPVLGVLGGGSVEVRALLSFKFYIYIYV